jgi:hypothetical protein
MLKRGELVTSERIQELVTPPVVKLSLVPACHPDTGFALEFRRDGQVSCICCECGETKVHLPMVTRELGESAAQAALALVNAAQIFERRDGNGSALASELDQSASRLAVALERRAVLPGGDPNLAPAHVQVLELVQRYGHVAVLEALAAVKGVSRA